jgi:hypothetical protein
MRLRSYLLVAPALAILAVGAAAAADQEQVPLFTGEDLDRMFGPAPVGPSVPVDKSHPGDWNTVESFIDREYARIDAERQHELNRQDYDRSADREDDSSRMYGSMLWGSGYYGGYYGAEYGGGYGGYGPGCGSRVIDDRGMMYRAAYARATGQTVRMRDSGLNRGGSRGGGSRGGGAHRGGSSRGGGANRGGGGRR